MKQQHIGSSLDDLLRKDGTLELATAVAVKRVKAAGAPRIGALKGQVVIPEDFNAPLPEQVLADFEGGA